MWKKGKGGIAPLASPDHEANSIHEMDGRAEDGNKVERTARKERTKKRGLKGSR